MNIKHSGFLFGLKRRMKSDCGVKRVVWQIFSANFNTRKVCSKIVSRTLNFNKRDPKIKIWADTFETVKRMIIH